jgi:rRNA maturation endonuclease Nob1
MKSRKSKPRRKKNWIADVIGIEVRSENMEDLPNVYKCVNCGKEFENGVIIGNVEFCARCSISPSAIAKAQSNYRKALGQK